MIERLNSAQFRQAWPQFSSAAKELFRILYLTQDFVPSSHIQEELNVSQEFKGIRARISVVLDDIAGPSSSYDCFDWGKLKWLPPRRSFATRGGRIAGISRRGKNKLARYDLDHKEDARLANIAHE